MESPIRNPSRCSQSLAAIPAAGVIGVMLSLWQTLSLASHSEWGALVLGPGSWVSAWAAILAYDLGWLLPGAVTAGLISALGLRRSGWGVLAASTSLVAAWFVIDLRVWLVTGNHAHAYFRYANEPNALDWSGGLGPILVPLGVPTVVAALVSAAIITILGRSGVVLRPSRSVRTLSITVSIVLVAMAMRPQFIASRIHRPLVIAKIGEAHPAAFGLNRAMVLDDTGYRSLANAELRAAAPKLLADLAAPAPVERGIEVSDPLGRDVVVIVAESFRAQSLNLRIMPRLNERARTGLRFDRHYSTAHSSHRGFFGLLYGRSAVGYTSTLAAEIPPQFPSTLRENGYRTVFLSSSEIEWEGMELFINRETFDEVVVDVDGEWPARDRRIMERALEALDDNQPTLVVTFLMSTHFPFHWEEGFGRHMPVAHPSSETFFTMSKSKKSGSETLEPWTNRYNNAVGFVDQLIDDFLVAVGDRPVLTVVTGDHGESLQDDGTWLHSSKLSEAQTRVPLVLLGPGIEPRRVSEPTTHADIVPTVLHALAGRSVGLKSTHGRDFLARPTPVQPPTFLSNSSGEHLLLLRGEARCRVSLDREQGEILMLGFTDRDENFLPLGQPPERTVSYWVGEVIREFERIGGR